MFRQLALWIQTRTGLFVMGLAALALAYAFVSWAIDSGSLLDYALTILLVFVGARDLTLAIFNKKKKNPNGAGPSSSA